MTLQPGWRWSEHIKPIAGTDWCQARHVGMIESGTLHTVHEDGTEVEQCAGDVYVIEPGHDGWVVGDEPVVGLEFESAESFAKGWAIALGSRLRSRSGPTAPRPSRIDAWHLVLVGADVVHVRFGLPLARGASSASVAPWTMSMYSNSSKATVSERDDSPMVS